MSKIPITLQEAKDQVAKRHGFDNFEECYTMGLETAVKELIKYCDEAAELYRSQSDLAKEEENKRLKEGIKKFIWHWKSYFDNKIVGNPPDLKDLERLIEVGEVQQAEEPKFDTFHYSKTKVETKQPEESQTQIWLEIRDELMQIENRDGSNVICMPEKKLLEKFTITRK